MSVLDKLVMLQPRERGLVGWAAALSFLLLSSLYAVRPLREEMGIASGVENMQWLFSGTFVAILLAVPLWGWAVGRWGRRILIPRVYAGLAATMVGLYSVWYAMPQHDERWVAAAIFVWISMFNLIAVSAFWSLMADLVDPAAAKRLFGVVAAGGSAGALVGPALSRFLSRNMDPLALLLVGAALLLLAAICAAGLHRAAGTGVRSDTQPVSGGVLAGIALLVRDPKLVAIAGYIVGLTWVATILYFTQANIIKEAIPDRGDRTALFAEIDFFVNLGAIGLQLLVTGRVIKRFGIGAALVALPVVSIGALAAIALVPTLAMMVVIQIVRRATSFAFAKPTREVLFTAVGREAKYKAKNVIDTVVYRGSDAVAGWSFAGASALGMTIGLVALATVPVAVGWAGLARALGREDHSSTSAPG